MATSEVVVHSHNIFVDTDRGEPILATAKGDKFEIDLNTENVSLDEGQHLRLTLHEFSMYKNWTNVNDNNRLSELIIDTTSAPPLKRAIALDAKNYEFVSEIALDFSAKFKAVIDTLFSITGSITNLTPDNTTGINGTTDNIISFTYSAPLTTPTGLTSIVGRCPEGLGDAYALLGCNRIRDTDPDTAKSYDIAITETASLLKLEVKMLYPAQRNTTANIYLRTNLNTGGGETASLNDPNTPEIRSQVVHSSIFAKIPVNSEFCVFRSSTGREYFIDIPQKHLTHFRLFLTDEHNRQIGRRPSDTAANTPNFFAQGLDGLSLANNQSTLGNLNFSCVIRADIIQQRKPNHAFTEPFRNPTIAHQTGLLLNPSLPPI